MGSACVTRPVPVTRPDIRVKGRAEAVMWQRWVSFWAEREPAAPWAAFRIAVGLVLAWVAFSSLFWDAVPIFVDAAHGGFAKDGLGRWPWPWIGSSPVAVRSLLGACLVAALALAAGVGGRWTALLTGQLFLTFFSLHPGTGGGHDRLITNACWLLFLVDATPTWSVAVRWRTGLWTSDAHVLSLGRRLAQWQLVYMYVLTGFEKQGDAWFAAGDYRALYDTLLLPSWVRYDMVDVVPQLFPLLQVAAVVAWWWEALWFLVPLWAWWRRPSWQSHALGRFARAWDVRVPFVALGLITHGTLWVLMDLGPFSPMTFAFYLALWTADDTARWRAWRRSGRVADEKPHRA